MATHCVRLIVLLKVCAIYSFNVDTNYPILIQTISYEPPGFGGWTKPPTSNQFGASVAFLNPELGDHSWILIGAPKANSSLHPEIPEPGNIWQCSLGKSPAETCRSVVVDPNGNLHQGKIHEWKNASLLGGPTGLAISSQKFVACASRLERWEDGLGKDGTTVSFMHGSCYVRPRSHLLQTGTLPPAMANDFIQLNPLQDPQWEKSRINRNGQVGFAVHFSKTGSELVMSAPGIHRWMGILIQYISRDGGYSFQQGAITKPQECPASGRDCFNFLGYSLTSGYFYDKYTTSDSTPVYYAAGAPRAYNLKGRVLIFRFPSSGNASPENLLIEQELLGDQTGAYFGSSLLSLDLNGDGYDDLIVGAPSWSRAQRQRAGPMGRRLEDLRDVRGRAFDPFGGYGDEGAVFIYWSTNKGKGLLTRQQEALRGATRPWSHFGTALASVGDLNKDGFADFCVSAPYEDTSGVIYIYHGNADKVITKASQTIYGKRVDSGLRGFGFSLGGNEDVDKNGFPDLAIGSFNSSSVVILRARPIIQVQGRITTGQLVKLPVDGDFETFELKSCVQITAKTQQSQVNLKVEIKADAKFMPERVHVYKTEQNRKDSKSVLSYTQKIIPEDGEICVGLVARVVQPLDSTAAPVVFRQTITLPENEPEVKKRVMKIHTKDESLTVSGARFDEFCKTCPLIDADKPNEFEVTLPLAIPCGEDDRCQADLYLDVGFIDVEKEFVVGSRKSVEMRVKLTNRNETAIQPGVFITWRKLRLTRIPSGCELSKEDGPLIIYRCGFGRFLKMGESAEVTLEFDMSDLHASESGGSMEQQLFWNVSATTVSEMARRETKIEGLPLTYVADPYLVASRRFEVFNMATLAKYVVFQHQFDVQVERYTPIQGLTVKFQLPVNASGQLGDNSLVNVRGFKVEHDEGDGGFSCVVTKGHFSKNEDALADDSEEEEEFDEADYVAGGIGGLMPKDKEYEKKSNSSLVENDRLLLHCNSPFVSCMEVQCKKDTIFYPGSRHEIKFIIDVSSEDIRRLMKVHKVNGIEVESRGELVLGEVLRGIQPISGNKEDEAAAVTLIEREGHKPINKWIYILALVIGILILVCVAFCLYACGCFENKKMQKGGDQVDGEVEPTEEEMQPLQKPGGDPENPEITEESKIDQESMPISPFSDVVDPPEFIPTEPTIPEEPEPDPEEERKTSTIDSF